VNIIDERLPWVTPDAITIGSTLSMLALDYLVVKYPDKGLPIGVAQTVIVLGDIVDGGLARKKAASNDSETTLAGALIDTLSDKTQEFAVGVALSKRAAAQGDKVGATVHMFMAMTAPLPALTRARAEAGDGTTGNIVKEGGFGTRPIRATLGIVTVALLHDKPRTAQLVSAATVVQNVATAYQRYQAADPTSHYSIGSIEDPKQIAVSSKKYAALKLATLVTTAIGLSLLSKRKTSSPKPAVIA
jgi:phosphatidylglycerophosphate synthase